MSHDTILHRCLRPGIRWLARTSVTPDSLTVLRLATGLAASACFAHGRGAMLAGAALFAVSMLLDRADGELARQTRRFSRFGDKFDLVSDCVSTMAAFVGLGIGAVPGWMPPGLGLCVGIAAAVSVAVLFAQLNILPPVDRAGPAAPISRPFDPDDMMLAVPVAVACGGASWILLLSGTLAPAAAIGLSLHRRIRARRPAAAHYALDA